MKGRRILLLCFVYLSVVACRKTVENVNSINSLSKSEKNGFILQGNEVRYFLYDKVPALPFWNTPLNNDKHEIIKNGWIEIGRSDLTVADMYSDNANDISGTSRKFSYKIENETAYVAPDGKDWKKLSITILDDQPRVQGSFTRIMLVKLSCDFFNGTYEIVKEESAHHKK